MKKPEKDELLKKAMSLFNKNKSDRSFSGYDMESLIQELQVHQIELEMQNEELQRVNTENEELKNKYFELYELAPAGYLTLDRNGKILEINLTASELFSIEKSRMTGYNFTFFIDPAYFDIFHKSINLVYNTNARQTCIVKSKVVNNIIKHIQLDIIPFNDENGKVNKLYMAAMDVSVIKLAEEEIIKAKKIEDLNNAKALFMSNVNHELRTPLGAILGYSKILKNDDSLNEDQLNIITSLHKNGEILLSLINDLLDFSKFESGKFKINQQPFNLPDLIRDIAETAGYQAAEKNLLFSIETVKEIPVLVTGDEVKLRQVILNLINNAVKFTERGKVILRVGLSSKSILHFEIEDEGIGIDPEQADKIFEPFYQAPQGNHFKTKGFGLGLSISRQFIRLLGSDIYVKSKPGKGSVFSFDIYLEKVNDLYSGITLKKAEIKDKGISISDEFPAPPLKDINRLFEMTEAGDIIGIRQYIKKTSIDKPELQQFTNYMKKFAAKIDLKGIRELLSKYKKNN